MYHNTGKLKVRPDNGKDIITKVVTVHPEGIMNVFLVIHPAAVETGLTENHKSQPHGGTRERERWITKENRIRGPCMLVQNFSDISQDK